MFIRKAGAFNDRLEGMGVKSFVVWNSYTVRTVRHTKVFAFCYNLEPHFTECLNSSFRGDICKDHTRQTPLLHRRWHPLSPQLSFGGTS